MLQKWLETGKARTWRALEDALGSELVGQKAKILKKKKNTVLEVSIPILIHDIM